MTVAKLIEVLQQIPDSRQHVYLRSNPAGIATCTSVIQNENGGVMLGVEKENGFYYYPTQKTKEKTNDRRTTD